MSYGREYFTHATGAHRRHSQLVTPTAFAVIQNGGASDRPDAAVSVVGRVCMDQIMANVSDMGEVKMGDEGILIGQQRGRRSPHAAAWWERLTMDAFSGIWPGACGVLPLDSCCKIY